MADIVSRERRSEIMGRIRGKDTKPELFVRSGLHRRGLRYVLGGRGLAGRPDLVFPSLRAVVFVHGCFWHRHPGCTKAYSPKSRVEFWQKKFAENVARDRRVQGLLDDAGWRVFVIWECDVGDESIERLADELNGAGDRD